MYICSYTHTDINSPTFPSAQEMVTHLPCVPVHTYTPPKYLFLSNLYLTREGEREGEGGRQRGRERERERETV